MEGVPLADCFLLCTVLGNSIPQSPSQLLPPGGGCGDGQTGDPTHAQVGRWDPREGQPVGTGKGPCPGGGGPLTADCSLDKKGRPTGSRSLGDMNLSYMKWVSRCVNEATASGEPTLEPTLPLAHPIPGPLPSRDCAKSDRPTHTSTRWCGACFEV